MTETRPLAPPAVRVSRVPDDLPYVVGPNGARYATIFGSCIAFLLVLPILVWVALDPTTEGGLSGMTWVPWFSALSNAAIMGFLWFMAASGGPRLALSPEGMWLRGINRPGRAHFLAWEDIDVAWLDAKHFLCLRPRDPNFVSGWRGQAGMEARAAVRRRGAPFAVPLGKHSDRSDRETLDAVWHFSGGRIAVGMRISD